MKKITEIKPGIKKRFLGGMAYIALAVTVVAVTIGSVVSYFDVPDGEILNNGADVPEISRDFMLKLPKNDVNINDFNLDTEVSDSPSGISAEIVNPSEEPLTDTKGVVSPSETVLTSDSALNVISDETDLFTDKTVPVSEEPEEPVPVYGFAGFIKPCSGYISKEFSIDVPVYSVSMDDYRAHYGVDIVCDVGTQVKASSNGVIADIYDDYLYGTTVVIEHNDGIKTVYSNLSPDLPVDTVKGKSVITGEIIAGVGESAACEASEAKHLHFEMIKDGRFVNPEDYLVN